MIYNNLGILPVEMRRFNEDFRPLTAETLKYCLKETQSDFFYLEHAKKYQNGDRIKIKELWVPAAMITEEGSEDEARILQSEARFPWQ